jgi:iron complex outermembrane receptor protein
MAFSCAAAAQSAFAQPAPDVSATVRNDQAAVDDSTGLAAIVVTAQHRAENVQDVPISISILSEERLEAQGTQSVLDLQHTTPGITFGQSAGFSNFYARGVGNSFATPAAQSPIAFYIDGVYLSNVSSAVFELADVSRVEILKGPQGTLYGRNAVGGAVNVITKTPTEEFDLDLSATYGNYNTRRASLYVSGGTPTVQANFSLSVHKSDGYYKNLIPGQRDLNAANSVSFRGKLRFTPNSDVEVILAGDYIKDKGYGFSGGGSFGYPETIGVGAPVVATDVLLGGQVTSRPWRTTYAGDFSNDIDNGGLSLTAKLDLGPVDLVSISAYRSFDFEHTIPTGASSSGRNIAFPTDLQRSLSQEFRLLSDTDGPFNWIAGVYYLRDRSGFNPLAVKQNIFFPITIDIFSKVRSKSYAAFAEGTYEIAPGLSIIAGLRYSDDKLHHYQAVTEVSLPFPPFEVITDSSGAKAHFSAVTPRLSVKYERDEGLYYATYSQGYRSGLFNVSNVAPTRALDLPVSPERLDAYEVGAKWELFDNRVRLNIAGFYYDDKDLQVQSLVSSGGTTLQNASARIKGIDIDGEWMVSDALTLRGGAGYLDAKYSSFPNAAVYAAHSAALVGTQQGVAPCPGDLQGTSLLAASCLVSQNLTGQRLLRSPVFTGTIAADIRLPIPEDKGSLLLSASLYHSDSFRTTANATLVSPAYDLVNASLRYVFPDERVSVMVFGTNLTNAKYYNTGGEQELSRGLMYGKPRMYGVTLNYSLK